MEKSPTWLLDYKYNVYSQTGEDGIIEKILEMLPHNDKWCVEFGAWDGMHLSNTRNLIEKKNYSAIFIEGDPGKFRELEKNYSHTEKIITINKWVGFNDRDNLDTILKSTPTPQKFDFLSIDIDGNDYHAWKVVSEYQPKVVCIEFNHTIPTEVRFVQPADFSVSQGSSLLSLVELGKEKGYELVSVLPFNAFFVRSEYYSLFQIEDNRPEILRTYLLNITYIFAGYDGTIFLRGYRKLIGHTIDLKEYKIQHLPKFLRKSPEKYGKIERFMFKFFLNSVNFIRGSLARLTKR